MLRLVSCCRDTACSSSAMALHDALQDITADKYGLLSSNSLLLLNHLRAKIKHEKLHPEISMTLLLLQ